MKPFIRYFLLLACLGSVAGIFFGYYVINQGFHLIPDSVKKRMREANLLENATAKSCSECHKAIYESWKKSRHSQAWVDEIYIKDSDNRSKEKCLPCHIPQEVRAGIKPDPRTWVRDDGIYCVPCHVVNKEMNGPYDLFSPPHPTRQNPEYRKSKICGSCHQKTLKEWEASGVEKTCQTCHMPRMEGRLTQKFPLSLLHSKKSVGDHRFPHGEIGSDDLLLSARVEGGAVIVVIQNLLIPHQVPTAENGDPRLFLYTLFYDAGGNEMDRNKEIFAPQQETALSLGKKMEFRYPLERASTTIAVSLQYQPAWSKEKSEIRKISLEIPKVKGKP